MHFKESNMKARFTGLMALALGMALSMSTGAFAQDGQSGDQQQGPPPQGEGQHEGMRGPGGEGHHGMPNPEERLKRLTEMLNLTADQQTKIKSIMTEEKTKMDDLRDDTQEECAANR